MYVYTYIYIYYMEVYIIIQFKGMFHDFPLL